MDQRQFDSLAQRWAITLSRRDGHRMLGGALLGLLAVTAAQEETVQETLCRLWQDEAVLWRQEEEIEVRH